MQKYVNYVFQAQHTGCQSTLEIDLKLFKYQFFYGRMLHDKIIVHYTLHSNLVSPRCWKGGWSHQKAASIDTILKIW